MTKLFGVPELAEALGVDRSTVHRRISRGEVKPFLTAGNRHLFRQQDIEDLAGTPQLPAVGSLWRFKSSKKLYKVTHAAAELRLITLRALDTNAATSLSPAEFASRCIRVEEDLA